MPKMLRDQLYAQRYRVFHVKADAMVSKVCLNNTRKYAAEMRLFNFFLDVHFCLKQTNTHHAG